MLVKDEADIIAATIEHLLGQVDEIIVADNGSTDGTLEILAGYPAGYPLEVQLDTELGYWQSRKTTQLAMEALARGHQWVVPCDADEFWYAPDLRPISDFLAGLAPDTQVVKAPLFHHLPTALDPPADCEVCENSGVAVGERHGETTIDLVEDPCSACEGLVEPNPFKRIGWRKREQGALPKVACRLRPDLVIEAGNHSATTSGTGASSSGLVVRHYSWRSAAQYVRKIRNGAAAYAATTLPQTTGEHWRMWDDKPDEALVDHFNAWFHSGDPYADDTLIYDPAPLAPSE
jgi:glycosyltransferase involved in cell wall biosynthesis